MYSQKEKMIIVSMITTLVIICGYSLYIHHHYIAGQPEMLNDFKFWGKAFLILMPIMIVAQIIVHILFAIITKILTDEDIQTLTDEMDRLIELKALRISHWTYPLGFFLAMASQAAGMQPWVLIVVLAVSCFTGCIFSEIAKIYYYRKGV